MVKHRPLMYNKFVKKLLKYCVVKLLFNGPVYTQVTGNVSGTFVLGCMKYFLNVTIRNVISTIHIGLFNRYFLETLYKRFT